MRQRLQQRRRDCDHSVRQTYLNHLFCKSSNFFQVVLIVTTLLFLGFHAPRVNIVLGRDDSNDQDDVTSGDYPGDDERV